MLGATASSAYTVTPTAATFGIDQTTNTTTGAVVTNPSLVAMNIGDSLVVRVNAPAPAANGGRGREENGYLILP